MTDINYETLLVTRKSNLVTITLNRPEQANGLNKVMASELAKVAAQIDADATVKVVILTGSGRFFSAGGDVIAMSQAGEELSAEVKSLANSLHEAISTFARMRAPLIVAVNGTAAGAGFSLAIVGDLVLASESSSFTMAYTKVGLSPDGSASFYLPRLVGVRKAQELMFTNRVLVAEEALEWGLVNKVVADDDLLTEAEALADMFLSGASGSNSAIKKLLLQTFSNGLETQMEIEGRLLAECASTSDGREGIKAFSEKRAPLFQ